MTPRQRGIIGLLVIANVALFATLLVFFTRFSGSMSQPGLPSPAPASRERISFSPACRRRAVQMLSHAGLGGTAALSDQTIQFDLAYRVTQERPAEDIAQQVWRAFDVALALANGPCDAFSHVDIVIEAQGALRPTRACAAVDVTDLQAFHDGTLSENAFIERVRYWVQPVDEG
jgi:hypothetical protein